MRGFRLIYHAAGEAEGGGWQASASGSRRPGTTGSAMSVCFLPSRTRLEKTGRRQDRRPLRRSKRSMF